MFSGLTHTQETEGHPEEETGAHGRQEQQWEIHYLRVLVGMSWGGNLVPTGSSQGDITASAKAHSLQSQPLLTKTYLEFVECHRLGVNSSKHPHPSLQNLSEWISYHHRLTLCWMILLRCVKGDSSLRYQLMPSFCYLYLER